MRAMPTDREGGRSSLVRKNRRVAAGRRKMAKIHRIFSHDRVGVDIGSRTFAKVRSIRACSLSERGAQFRGGGFPRSVTGRRRGRVALATAERSGDLLRSGEPA